MRYIKFYEDLVDYNKFSEIIAILESECKEFLDEMGSEILYRGSYLSSDYCLKSVRSNRRPMDMNNIVNGLLSDAFIKKFGVSIRKEGVFSTKNADIAYNYGSVCMFFPVGSYKYYYTKMFTDLYVYISNRLWYHNLYIDYSSYVSKTEFGEYCYNGENGIYRTFIGNITVAMDRIISCYSSEVRGMDTSIISDKMSLLPRMTLEEYNSYNEFEREKDIDYIVNTYVSDNISDVIDEEIVFVCDKYYLVDSKFYGKMRDYLRDRLV